MEKKFVWKRILALLLAVSMVLSSQSFTSLAVEYGIRTIVNNTYDLKNWVSSMKMYLLDEEGNRKTDAEGKDIELNGGTVEEGAPVELQLGYTVPSDVYLKNGDQLTLQLDCTLFDLSLNQEGTVYFDGAPVGTFTVGSDGKVVITFDERLDKLGKRVTAGVLSLKGNISKLKDGSEGKDGEVWVGDQKIDFHVKPKEDTKVKDVTIKKDHVSSKPIKDPETGEIIGVTYRVKVTASSENTELIDHIVVQDTLTGNAHYKDPQKPVVLRDGTSGEIENGEVTGTCEVSGNSATFDFTIAEPKMGAGDYFTFTYDVLFDDDFKGKENDGTDENDRKIPLHNEAQVTEGADNKPTAEHDYTYKNKMVDKLGTLVTGQDGTPRIRYTVTVNENADNLGEGWYFWDKCDSQMNFVYPITVYQYDGNGTLKHTESLDKNKVETAYKIDDDNITTSDSYDKSRAFRWPIPSGPYKWVFVYETTFNPYPPKNKWFGNTAYLSVGNDTEHGFHDSIGIGYSAYGMTKRNVSEETNVEDNLIAWEAILYSYGNSGMIPAETWYQDTLSIDISGGDANVKHIFDQDKFDLKFSQELSEGTYVDVPLIEGEDYDLELDEKSFKITFRKAIQGPLRIKYYSVADAFKSGKADVEQVYKNSGEMHVGDESFTGEDEYRYKNDSGLEKKAGTYDPKTGTIIWEIYLNEGGVAKSSKLDD